MDSKFNRCFVKIRASVIQFKTTTKGYHAKWLSSEIKCLYILSNQLKIYFKLSCTLSKYDN